ncbi:MAG: DUF4893 domain-containing protein [Paracoccus sp. (in: a-proteobacteria)]|nr:DUF4893 domain-containing protein [Paracoccus sp. (in: a-proteobacteria)]
MIRPARHAAAILVIALMAPPLAAQDAALPADAPSPALADGTPVRAEDMSRLDRLNASAGQALREAFAGGSADDLATLRGALAGQAMPPDQAMGVLAGSWECQVVKLGRGNPVIVYQPFRCEAGTEEFRKVSGSQLIRGSVHRDGGRLVLLGVGYIAGDTPPDYAGLAVDLDPAATPQITTNPGVIEMTGPDSGRILFPWPTLESHMDILILRRR